MKKSHKIAAIGSTLLVAIYIPTIFIDYPPRQETNVQTPATPQTLEEARDRAAIRLAKLKSMTEEDWQKERSLDSTKPASLQEAIEKNEAIVIKLFDMSEEDWKNAQEKHEKRVKTKEFIQENQRSSISKIPSETRMISEDDSKTVISASSAPPMDAGLKTSPTEPPQAKINSVSFESLKQKSP